MPSIRSTSRPVTQPLRRDGSVAYEKLSDPILVTRAKDGDRQALEALCARHANLHLDISGTGIDRLGMVRHAIDILGPQKVLFGSDYPVNNPAVYVAGVAYEPLTEAEREALLHGNVERLLGEG